MPAHATSATEKSTRESSRSTMSNKPLTREEVASIKPADVHNVLGKLLLVDGFDVVSIIPECFATPLFPNSFSP